MILAIRYYYKPWLYGLRCYHVIIWYHYHHQWFVPHYRMIITLNNFEYIHVSIIQYIYIYICYIIKAYYLSTFPWVNCKNTDALR